MNVPFKLVKANKLESLEADMLKITKVNATATTFIQDIEKGNLNAAFSSDADQEDGLIKALLAMQEQLKKIAEEERQRNWATEGLAKFVEIMRSNGKQSNDFYQLLISSLIKYMGANQGGLFLVDDRDKSDISIDLVSAYAYNRQKYLTKKIIPGEGLVGQCYLEKETMILSEIPGNYIGITSGLGTANPNFLIVVPLKVNDEVQGILELASFTTLKPYQIEFIERLAESLAATLATLKINQQTQQLLTETQQQAEQMRSQEEELRQNMEELGATQEEMSRVSVEMEGQLAAINKTMATIEFELNGNIISANQNFLKLLEYDLHEIEGKHHQIFVEKGEKNSDAYRKFWEDLSKGINVIGEFKRITKSGKHIYIKGIYNPILDQAGNTQKVLKIAYDITESKEMELTIKNQLEETQAQEEELRQNMEELGATQDEMSRVSAEMESQISAINKTLATIEFDLDGKIRSANENFLSLMGYSLDEIVGKHHRIFVEEKEKESQAYRKFWSNLSAGQSEVGEFKRLHKDGTEVYIKGIYNPILDQKGNPLRIFKIAHDITRTKQMELLLRHGDAIKE